jgi:hypothetical protein
MRSFSSLPATRPSCARGAFSCNNPVRHAGVEVKGQPERAILCRSVTAILRSTDSAEHRSASAPGCQRRAEIHPAWQPSSKHAGRHWTDPDRRRVHEAVAQQKIMVSTVFKEVPPRADSERTPNSLPPLSHSTAPPRRPLYDPAALRQTRQRRPDFGRRNRAKEHRSGCLMAAACYPTCYPDG